MSFSEASVWLEAVASTVFSALCVYVKLAMSAIPEHRVARAVHN